MYEPHSIVPCCCGIVVHNECKDHSPCLKYSIVDLKKKLLKLCKSCVRNISFFLFIYLTFMGNDFPTSHYYISILHQDTLGVGPTHM
jgi:hypothetical protein